MSDCCSVPKAVILIVYEGTLTSSVIGHLMVPISGASLTLLSPHHIQARTHYSELLYSETWER